MKKTGWYTEDGEYFADENDAVEYLRECGFKSIEQAYNIGFIYYYNEND